MDIFLVGNIIGLVVPVLIMIAFFRFEKFEKLRRILDEWFYVDFVYRQADIRSKFLRRAFRIGTKFFEGVYVLIVPFMIIQLLISLNDIAFEDLIFIVLMLIAIPPICRFLLFIQFKFHGVK